MTVPDPSWRLRLSILLDGWERAHAAFDDAVGRLGDRHRSRTGELPTCPTCTSAACCRQLAVAGIDEALVIARVLRRTRRATPALRDALYEAGRAAEASGRTAHFAAQVPCPLLEDSRCTVYEVRPTACRGCLSLDSPSRCSPPSGQRVRYLNAIPVEGVYLRMLRQRQRDLGLGADRVYMASIPRAVAVALDVLKAPSYEAALRVLRSEPFPTVDEAATWFAGRSPWSAP